MPIAFLFLTPILCWPVFLAGGSNALDGLKTEACSTGLAVTTLLAAPLALVSSVVAMFAGQVNAEVSCNRNSGCTGDPFSPVTWTVAGPALIVTAAATVITTAGAALIHRNLSREEYERSCPTTTAITSDH
ncbi:hypothetical protein [Williamsia sp. 1135]|uniref:hypothetical protein n=1 Tax=Williamsia sp. 1135 TaxID=1889262 RepID=UPI000A26108E|nr:hypothetical protein [Williamsia sp. 1135]ORM36228.1 hypothetical protein BFL43_07815 [Williamsia sp. 1135]